VRDTASVRITGIRLDRLLLPLDPPFPAAWDPVPRGSFAATIVRVETDEGVTGIGSGDTMAGFDAFEHLFLGQDPTAIARHVRVLETIDFHAGRYWPLEAALWDLLGKVAGLPVATLFGGAIDGIPAYASCGSLLAPAARAESALRLREEGFLALKIRIDPRRLEEGLTSVTATRHAVGDSMAIMVDLNQGWRMAGDTSRSLDPVAAREIAARLADDGVLWVEEPLAGTDLRGLAGLRASAPGTRVAGGEMTRTFAEQLAALDADAFDVYQPDCTFAGGITVARKVAAMAEAAGLLFAPHTWTNGLGLAVGSGLGRAPHASKSDPMAVPPSTAAGTGHAHPTAIVANRNSSAASEPAVRERNVDPPRESGGRRNRSCR